MYSAHRVCALRAPVSFCSYPVGVLLRGISQLIICCLCGDSDVQKSEHPATLNKSSANVTSVQEKLSREAFSGGRVRLLNAKNILIDDVEGTRGK